MPVTPLHVGPALVIKAACGAHFSLLVFVLSQVLMDLEPAIRMLRGDAVLHGPSHTYLGATVIALASLFAGRPLCEWFLRRFQADPRSPFLVWLHGANEISWHAAAISAFVGTYSHVLLDSLMHGDMEPLAPWSQHNGMLLLVSVDALNLLCLGSGVLGVVLLGAAFILRSRRAPGAP